jgi:AcrR family transcriptional regulator
LEVSQIEKVLIVIDMQIIPPFGKIMPENFYAKRKNQGYVVGYLKCVTSLLTSLQSCLILRLSMIATNDSLSWRYDVKKNLTKARIIETALELFRNNNGRGSLSQRELARTLDCAYQSMYRYIPTYNDLLWETHAALMGVFMDLLIKKLDAASTAELRLNYFFDAFASTYLENKGWFRLAWQEYIEGERPLYDIKATDKISETMAARLSVIWTALSGAEPDTNVVKRILHNTHCYIVGEVSNFILGRRLVQNEAELRVYITREATHMFKLGMANPS